MDVKVYVILLFIFLFHYGSSDGRIDITEPSSQFVTQDTFQTGDISNLGTSILNFHQPIQYECLNRSDHIYDLLFKVLNGIKEAFDRRMNSTDAELRQVLAGSSRSMQGGRRYFKKNVNILVTEIENLKLMNVACSEEISRMRHKFDNSDSMVTQEPPGKSCQMYLLLQLMNV